MKRRTGLSRLKSGRNPAFSQSQGEDDTSPEAGRIDMHNNAIERCFRYISIVRRNWLHTGSHASAQNIAFMFGLYESCKLNNVDFGHYIEDILTRIVNGESIDDSFIPCNYVARPLEEEHVA